MTVYVKCSSYCLYLSAFISVVSEADFVCPFILLALSFLDTLVPALPHVVLPVLNLAVAGLELLLITDTGFVMFLAVTLEDVLLVGLAGAVSDDRQLFCVVVAS